MKKLTAFISALALLLSLCACSSQARGAEGEKILPEPGPAGQDVKGSSSQNHEPVNDVPTAPVKEAKAPESSEEAQPSSSVPEASASGSEVPATPPASDTAPVSTSKPEPAPEPVSAPEPPPKPEPTPAADPKVTAQNLIGHSVSELFAAIGKPISSDYAPGCLEPDSEDGELVYSGFTVYTVRTATEEYVFDVL